MITQTDIELRIMRHNITTPEEILNEVAFITGIPKSVIKSKKRTDDVASARRIICHFLREENGMTYQSIGDFLNVGHDTALYHNNKVKDSIDQAKTFEKELYRKIKNKYING